MICSANRQILPPKVIDMTVVELATKKESHAACHYRKGTPSQHCGNCDYHSGTDPMHCSKVVDPINPQGKCDWWEREKGPGMSREGLPLDLASPTSTVGRRKLASKKQALPDGSFPIPNLDYLGRAIKAVGRAAPGKRPALARLIRKRARQIPGGMARIKGSWVDRTQSAAAMSIALREALEFTVPPEAIKLEMALTQRAFDLAANPVAEPVLGKPSKKRKFGTSKLKAGNVANATTKSETDTAAAGARKHTADAQADQLKSVSEVQADHALYARVHGRLKKRGRSDNQAHREALRAVQMSKRTRPGKE